MPDEDSRPFESRNHILSGYWWPGSMESRVMDGVEMVHLTGASWLTSRTQAGSPLE